MKARQSVWVSFDDETYAKVRELSIKECPTSTETGNLGMMIRKLIYEALDQREKSQSGAS